LEYCIAPTQEKQNKTSCVGRGLSGGYSHAPKNKGMVRSVDLARHMGFSKPSISHAVKVLREGGFLTMDEEFFIFGQWT